MYWGRYWQKVFPNNKIIDNFCANCWPPTTSTLSHCAMTDWITERRGPPPSLRDTVLVKGDSDKKTPDIWLIYFLILLSHFEDFQTNSCIPMSLALILAICNQKITFRILSNIHRKSKSLKHNIPLLLESPFSWMLDHPGGQ